MIRAMERGLEIFFACPFCDSETAQRIRTELFGHGFGLHLAAIVAPFVLVAALGWGWVAWRRNLFAPLGFDSNPLNSPAQESRDDAAF